MKKTILTLLSLILFSNLQAASLKTRMFPVKLGLNLRIGIVEATGRDMGDVLFFHGFGDRLDNHMPLFEELSAKGLRVISFDLPSHGETSGLLNNIDLYSFEDILEMAVAVDKETRIGGYDRPLILAGWSTGGLLAIRAVQKQTFQRYVEGLILLAPAVSVPALVGVKGFLTQASLTSNPNPPHFGKIAPLSPLLKPLFASHLLLNAAASHLGVINPSLPILTIVAGANDKYVKTEKVKEWAQARREESALQRIQVQCPKALHELDNEPTPVGNQVRRIVAEFALENALRFYNYKPKTTEGCEEFRVGSIY